MPGRSGARRVRYLAWSNDSPELRRVLARAVEQALTVVQAREALDIACAIGDGESVRRLSRTQEPADTPAIRACRSAAALDAAHAAQRRGDTQLTIAAFSEAARLDLLGSQDLFDFAQAQERAGAPAEAGYQAALAALLGAQRYSAETINDVQVVYVRAETIEVESQANATVRKAVMRALTDELNEGARSQTRLGCLNAEQRLADFLLGLIVDDAQSTPIEMSRADIADHLGLTIETVSRVFSKFAKLDLIDLINPHRFRAPNPTRLRGLVEGRVATSAPAQDASAVATGTISF